MPVRTETFIVLQLFELVCVLKQQLFVSKIVVGEVQWGFIKEKLTKMLLSAGFDFVYVLGSCRAVISTDWQG